MQSEQVVHICISYNDCIIRKVFII